MSDDVVIDILPSISDHAIVVSRFKVQYEQSSNDERTIFDYKCADWKNMIAYLVDVEWTRISEMQPNDAAIFLADCLHYCIDHFIPQRKINMFSSSHPWLNDLCRNAVERKIKLTVILILGYLQKNVVRFCLKNIIVM